MSDPKKREEEKEEEGEEEEEEKVIVKGGKVKEETEVFQSTCDGEYRKEKELRNGKFCFTRLRNGVKSQGAIFYDTDVEGSGYQFWKICRNGSGITGRGWNFSQLPSDPESLYPPLGRWTLEHPVSQQNHPRDIDYSNLELELSIPQVALKPAKYK